MRHYPIRRLRRLAAVLIAAISLYSVRSQVFLIENFSVNEVIPDAGDLSKSFTWNQPQATINSLQVGLQIDGVPADQGWNGDLYATLGHNVSDGFAVLLNRPGKSSIHPAGYSDSGMSVTFSDSPGTPDIHLYRDTLNGDTARLSGPVTGVWASDGRQQDPNDVLTSSVRSAFLTSFESRPVDGEWRLEVSDFSGGQTQSLVSWSLKVNASFDSGQTVFLGGEALEPAFPGQNFANPIQLTQSSTIQNNGAFQLSGQITGSGGLTKSGPGELVISGNNTYTGPTVVQEGRLSVQNLTGSATGTGSVDVLGSGTLGGVGHISGPVTIHSGGAIAPGNSPGILSLGNTTWGPAGNYLWSINQASGVAGANPGWSLLNVAGNLSITASASQQFRIAFESLLLDDSPGAVHDFDPHLNYRWTIATASGTISGFDPAALQIDTSGFLNDTLGGIFKVSVSGADLQVEYVPVPESAACTLLSALTLLAFAAACRSRRTQGRGN